MRKQGSAKWLAGVDYCIKRLTLSLTDTEQSALRKRLTAAAVLPCERKRYLALWHSLQGQTPDQIAALNIMSAKCVRNTIHAYHAGGLDALLERVHPGRSSRLTPEIITVLSAEIDRGERVWSSRTLVEYVDTHFGVSIERTAMRTQLHKHGLSWQRTRHVVAGAADPGEKAEFKNLLEDVKKGLKPGSTG